jgi:hypothetical protein
MPDLPKFRLLDGRALEPVDKEMRSFKVLDEIGEILVRI